MNYGSPLETFTRAGFRILDEDCREQIAASVNGHLHDSALHLIALPKGVTREEVHSFDARLASLL